METAKIVFSDGTELTAEENGSCLIFDEKPTLPGDLSLVTVISENGTTVYQHAEAIECASVDGRYWLTFVETPAEELFKRKMLANIATIAEMTDIDLDSEDPSGELSLKERINDLEIAICELMDSLA